MSFTAKYFNQIYQKLEQNPGILVVIILLLLPFALFLNLGLMPLISDEPTRGIVTLEMIISDNYIVPTINGEFYYNKPPLYNWILAGFIWIFGNASEFTLRLPTIISLLLMGLTIYLISRKTFSKMYAFLIAIMFITSARILFWDSFQGLIDITYSLVTLSSFVLLFHYSLKKKFIQMFLLTYALTSVGFLMKGLPSLAFQGISLLVWMTHTKNFKKLFSWQHLAGIGLFVIILGSYYYAYLRTNPLESVFATLVSESNRLNTENGTFLKWILNLFIFPVDMTYHFAPWTLLLLLLFDKRIRSKIYNEEFFRFCLIVLASNIIIYWISANMRPRYIFMLYPLLLFILTKAYTESLKINNFLFRFSIAVFRILGFIGAVSILFYLFWDETRHLTGIWIIIPILFVLAFFSALLALKYKHLSIHFLIIILLSMRIAFNVYNLQARYNGYPDAGYKNGEVLVGQITKGHDLYLLGDTPFNHDASFYISRERMQIVKRTTEIKNTDAFYIVDKKNMAEAENQLGKCKIYLTFTIKLNETELYLIKPEA